jgi:hypothetical protein
LNQTALERQREFLACANTSYKSFVENVFEQSINYWRQRNLRGDVARGRRAYASKSVAIDHGGRPTCHTYLTFFAIFLWKSKTINCSPSYCFVLFSKVGMEGMEGMASLEE